MRTTPDMPTGVLLGSTAPAAHDAEISVSDYLQIRDYGRILYRWRWMIVGIVATGLACAALLNWMATPIFEAQATVQIDTDPNILGVDRPVLPVDQRDWMREFVPTQLGILQSRDLARAAHEKLAGVRSSGSIGSGVEKQPSGAAGASSPPATGGAVPTVDQIVVSRSISLIKDTRLVNVAFRSPDPVTAARVADALARAYVEQNATFKAKANADASDWLTKQVEQQRQLVNDSEATLQRYRQAHGADALFTDKSGIEQQNIVVQKLAALQTAVTKARTETIEKEALHRQVSAVEADREPLDSVPAIAGNPYIQTLKAEVAALQRQMAQTSKELGDKHPDYIKVQGALQNAEQKLQAEVANAVLAIRHDYETTRASERSLTAALAQQKLEVQQLNGKSVEYTTLEREANSNREVLDKLLQRSREVSLARQLQSTSIRIIDSARIPTTPVLPRKPRTWLIGLVGAGGFAVMLAFGLEIFNTRMMSPADVRRYLRIRVLGLSPEVPLLNGRQSPILGNGAPVHFAELFQGLRTNVVTAPELATDRTLLVTSSEPGEGKTVAAANLAISLAGLRQRVLLIDADLRNPRLHEVFGHERQPGLSDILKGKTTTRDFRKTKVAGLWLMPAGGVSRNAANLLGSDSFSRLIDYLRQHFDWVIIDSPPVLAVTDPCLIARVVSGVLLVVDCRRTAREVASAAVERLDAVGATIVGGMLNRVPLERPAASYLPYYHRDYKTYYPCDDDTFEPPALTENALEHESASASKARLMGSFLS